MEKEVLWDNKYDRFLILSVSYDQLMNKMSPKSLFNNNRLIRSKYGIDKEANMSKL